MARHCLPCNAEYRDDVTVCAACGGATTSGELPDFGQNSPRSAIPQTPGVKWFVFWSAIGIVVQSGALRSPPRDLVDAFSGVVVGLTMGGIARLVLRATGRNHAAQDSKRRGDFVLRE